MGYSSQGFEQYPRHDTLEQAIEYGKANLHAVFARMEGGTVSEEEEVFVYLAAGRFVCGRASDMFIQQHILSSPGGGEIVGYISNSEFYPLGELCEAEA